MIRNNGDPQSRTTGSATMLKTLSDFFLSIDIHPVIGGFLLGVLFCVALLAIKRALGIEVRKSTTDDLARFRDPSAFSSGVTTATKMTFFEAGGQKTLPDPISAEVMQALRKGNKIEAIKIFKDATGLGLKESKDIVESLQNKLGL